MTTLCDSGTCTCFFCDHQNQKQHRKSCRCHRHSKSKIDKTSQVLSKAEEEVEEAQRSTDENHIIKIEPEDKGHDHELQVELNEKFWSIFCKYLALSAKEKKTIEIETSLCPFYSTYCGRCTNYLDQLVQLDEQLKLIQLQIQQILAKLSSNIVDNCLHENVNHDKKSEPLVSSSINNNNVIRKIIASRFRPSVAIKKLVVSEPAVTKQVDVYNEEQQVKQFDAADDDNYDRLPSPSASDSNCSDSNKEEETNKKTTKIRKKRRGRIESGHNNPKRRRNKKEVLNFKDNEEAKAKSKTKAKQVVLTKSLGNGVFQHQGYTFSHQLLNGVQMYVCGSCPNKRKHRFGMVKHIKERHVNIGDPTIEETIEKTKQIPFTDLGNGIFQRENWTFSLNPSGKFACGHCPAIQQHKTTIIRHIKRKHMGIFQFTCQVADCDFGAANLDVFMNHQLNVHLIKPGTPEFELIPTSYDRFVLDGYWTFQVVRKRVRNLNQRELNDNNQEDQDQGQEKAQVQGQQFETFYKCQHCYGFKSESREILFEHLRNHPASGKGQKKGEASSSDNNAFASRNKEQDEKISASQPPTTITVEKSDNGEVNHFGGGKFQYLGQYDFETSVHGFKCSICNRVCQTKMGIIHHIKYYHAEGQFSCDKCERTFVSETVMKQHYCNPRKFGQTLEISPGHFEYDGQYTFDKLGEEMFKCGHCEVIRKSRDGIKNHIRQKHTGQLLTCHICGRSFSARNPFDGHMATHFDVRAFVCEACGKTFKSSHSLAKHRRLTHRPPDKEFKCDVCDAILSTGDSLLKHKKIRHGVEINLAAQLAADSLEPGEFQF